MTDKEYNCVYLETEEIGGVPELNATQYSHYCRKKNKYNDDIKCKDCKEKILYEE
jgi:hypothetical protein